MKKFVAILATAVLGMGLALVAIAAPASAHTPVVTPSCSTLSVSLTNYATKSGNATPNTVKVVIDGTTKIDSTFGSTFTASYPLVRNTAHTWSVVVRAWDNAKYNVDKTGTTTPCLTVVTMPNFSTTEPSCTSSSGSYTVPTTTGLTYSKNSGTYPATAASTVKVTATAKAGYAITGAASWTHTFTAAASDCTVIVTPIAPTATAITQCGTTGSVAFTNTAAIHYALTSGDGKSGAWTVTATAQGSNVFAVGVSTKTFTGDLGPLITCVVLPHDPTATNIICTRDDDADTAVRSGGSITVAPVAGITYTITGGPAGTPITPIVIVSHGTAPIVTSLGVGSYLVTASGTNLDPTAVPTALTILDTSGGCLATLPFTSGTVSATDQTCTSGRLSSGSITVALDAPTLSYTLAGRTLGEVTPVAPGTYTVTMVPVTGYHIDTTTATVTVHAVSAACGELTTLAIGDDGGTLAFTGGTLVGAGILGAAALFLLAGGVLIRRSRRVQQ
jgi:hypothetical protein